MSKWLIPGSFNASKWLLCAVGAVALLLTALVATPLTRPPELHSISDGGRGSVDMGTLPPIERFQARGITPAIDVKLIDGIDHMGVVSVPKAVSVIADGGGLVLGGLWMRRN